MTGLSESVQFKTKTFETFYHLVLTILFTEQVIKYSAPKGDMFGNNNLEDISYDGIESNGIMSDGLGQLVDSVLGEEPESLVAISDSPSNWVGWNARKLVQLVFEFAQLQEFANCFIHVAHLPHLNIEVCSNA